MWLDMVIVVAIVLAFNVLIQILIPWLFYRWHDRRGK